MKIFLTLMVVMLAASCAMAGEDPLSPSAVHDRIIKYRTAQTTLTIVGMDGKPLKNAAITITQTRHQFLFGCNAFMLAPEDQSKLQLEYQKRFAAVFNYAALPFYWRAYEYTQGKPQVSRLRAMAAWLKSHGIHSRGEPLCWWNVLPDWLNGKKAEEVLPLQLKRIDETVRDFAADDLVDEWEVGNETVLLADWPQRAPLQLVCNMIGRKELLRRSFETARRANPKATLMINDYEVTPKFESVLKDCIASKTSFDCIGIQSHMHKEYWTAQRTWDACEEFSKFGHPIYFTETTIVSAPVKPDLVPDTQYTDWKTTPAGEALQAKQVEEFYTILFSHPAVAAITWWDLTDLNSWMNAPSGLLRSDMSPKPAYEILEKLIKHDWWTSEKLTTDENGKVSFRGYLGDYSVSTPQGDGRIVLDRAADLTKTVNLQSAP